MRPPNFSRNIFILVLLVLSLGCGSGGGGGGGTSEDMPEGLKLFDFASNTDALRVLVGENAEEVFLQFGDSVGYLEAPEGTVPIRVLQEDDILPSISSSLSIASGKDYSYIITVDEDDKLEGTLLSDDNTDPDTGLFRVRFINAATASTGVDGYLTFPEETQRDRDPVALDVQFKAASAYISVDEGVFRVYFTGSNGTSSLAKSESFAFLQGHTYSVYFAPDEGGGRPYHVDIVLDR